MWISTKFFKISASVFSILFFFFVLSLIVGHIRGSNGVENLRKDFVSTAYRCKHDTRFSEVDCEGELDAIIKKRDEWLRKNRCLLGARWTVLIRYTGERPIPDTTGNFYLCLPW